MTLEVGEYIEKNKPRFLSELLELLKIPSVSADPEYKDQVVLMANKVAEHLEAAGVQKVTIYPTPGHPIVYGEHLISPSAPTVLVYGHYDVQPADPL